MTTGRQWSYGESPYYFAYGSNMNPERMAVRGLRHVSAEGARLHGYELVFDKVSQAHPTSAHANIRVRPGAIVEGVLYHLGNLTAIEGLDRFERTPINYSRELFAVHTQAGEAIWTWTYVANPAVRGVSLAPEREYLDHLLAGRDFLSPAYGAMLERVRTR